MRMGLQSVKKPLVAACTKPLAALMPLRFKLRLDRGFAQTYAKHSSVQHKI
jgi:hypothetical protein